MARKRSTAPNSNPPDIDTVSGQLREAIRAHGDFYGLGKDAGVDVGVLYRFAKGQRGMLLETFDRVARALGLRLVQEGKPNSDS